jgi:nitrogenase subunit NifH
MFALNCKRKRWREKKREKKNLQGVQHYELNLKSEVTVNSAHAKVIRTQLINSVIAKLFLRQHRFVKQCKNESLDTLVADSNGIDIAR